MLIWEISLLQGKHNMHNHVNMGPHFGYRVKCFHPATDIIKTIFFGCFISSIFNNQGLLWVLLFTVVLECLWILSRILEKFYSLGCKSPAKKKKKIVLGSPWKSWIVNSFLWWGLWTSYLQVGIYQRSYCSCNIYSQCPLMYVINPRF